MYVYWTPDVTHDLIGYLTLVLTDSTYMIYRFCDRHLIEYLTGHILYCVLSTLLFIYFIHVISYSLIYIFFICSHVICTCTFQFILTHSLGVLTPWICISRFVAIYCWLSFWRGSQASWAARVLSYSIIFSRYFLSFLYSIAFMILCIGLMFIPFLFHMSLCVDVYMWHCSDIDLL